MKEEEGSYDNAWGGGRSVSGRGKNKHEGPEVKVCLLCSGNSVTTCVAGAE